MYATKGMSVTDLLSCLVRKTGLFGAYQKGLACMQYQEYTKAFDIWCKLAEQGNAQAQYDLGVMLHTGMRITLDSEKAIHWFTLASNNSHTDADVYLGMIYANGFRAPQNIEKAHYFLNRAASKGHEGAKVEVANLLSNGLPKIYNDD